MNSSKALVITSPVLSVRDVPYGPAVVSGILKANDIEPMIWDLNIDLYHEFKDRWPEIRDMLAIRGYTNPTRSAVIKSVLKYVKSNLSQRLQSIQPDFVLISVFSSHSLDFVIPLTTMIKKFNPTCYLLIGGRGLDNKERKTGLTYADFYAQYLPVDCVYQGDAENDLISVIKTRHRGLYKASPVNDQQMEDAPAANWNGIDLTRYDGYHSNSLYIPITGSKGCVRDCTFCDVAGSWPKYVYRRGEKIAREIIDIYQSTGMTKFEFTDNLVNGSIKNFREMNQLLAKEIPDILSYKAYAICRPKKEMPQEDFSVARRAGATYFKVGIESGSQKVRYDMKKKFTNEDITWFAENCHDQGIYQLWLMFVGYPTETEEDFQQTLDMLRDHRHLAGPGRIGIFLSLPMMLTMNSKFMREYQEQYGLDHNQHDTWSDFFWTSSKFTTNTFEIRLDRWKRLVDTIYHYGYGDPGNARQAEKFLEIEGIEKIYRENYSNGKRIIPINPGTIYINKESHV